MKGKANRKKEVKEAIGEIKQRDRYLGILWEDIKAKFETIAEGYAFLNEKMDRQTIVFNRRFNELELILKDHSKILAEHSKILAEHSKILAEHSKMIGSIQKDIEIMKQDIAFIKGKLKKKVDIDDFMRLEKRVALLEAKIS